MRSWQRMPAVHTAYDASPSGSYVELPVRCIEVVVVQSTMTRRTVAMNCTNLW